MGHLCAQLGTCAATATELMPPPCPSDSRGRRSLIMCPEIGPLAIRRRESDQLWTGCPDKACLPPLTRSLRLLHCPMHFVSLLLPPRCGPLDLPSFCQIWLPLSPSPRARADVICASPLYERILHHHVFALSVSLPVTLIKCHDVISF